MGLSEQDKVKVFKPALHDQNVGATEKLACEEDVT